MTGTGLSPRTAWAALLASALAGCGVGLSYGFGAGDDPPAVSLAIAPQTAAPGAILDLVAAASDDYGVREVRFYRADTTGDVLLGRDASAPYAMQTTLPSGAVGEVRYFSRAEDDAGQVTQSAVVSVMVR